MPTVRPRWSIEGTQWSAPQNTEREPRELLSNEEREAMRKTIEDADRATETALSTTQRLHQRLQGLEDQGFVPGAPEYRSSERNQAEVAILSRGDRLSAAQLRNETQKVLNTWSADDAEHWRVTHVYGKGRASRLRRKKTGERQELAETRQAVAPLLRVVLFVVRRAAVRSLVVQELPAAVLQRLGPFLPLLLGGSDSTEIRLYFPRV